MALEKACLGTLGYSGGGSDTQFDSLMAKFADGQGNAPIIDGGYDCPDMRRIRCVDSVSA